MRLPALRVGRRLRHPGRLRGARVLGGRRRRPRHHARRQPALPADARARNATRCGAPTQSRRSAKACAATSWRAASPAQRVTVIPNAVDVDSVPLRRARPTRRCRQQLGLDGATVHRLRRLVLRLRGPRPAARGAAARLLPRVPELRVLLVGGGPQEAALQRAGGALGLGRSASCSPAACRTPRCSATTSSIDVLAYPRHSMRLTELVTPLKPLEAMAQGRLLVASDVGGHRELIRDGETGFLFAAGDAGALARARSTRCSRDATDWPRISAAGAPLRRDRAHLGAQRGALRAPCTTAAAAPQRAEPRPRRCALRARDAMCGIHGLSSSTARRSTRALLARDGRVTRPSRPRRRGHARRRPLRDRHAAPVDHRRGRRPSAARATPTARSWLVCNGEIYNFRELRAELAGARPPLQHALG